VASRLAEHKQWRVLLLEAGPEEDFSHTFPLVQVADPQATSIDWNFTTVPQTTSGAGLIGQVTTTVVPSTLTADMLA
jgi:choline dehydrogenase-like flavoprotein